jgi:MarR-like DNA-binding transcriptional regulator SgrR of sgrS sRNA
MSPTENRILKALASRPMTVRELEPVVFCGELQIRALLRRMSKAGVVRLGGEAPRVNAVGSAPRYWEKVA